MCSHQPRVEAREPRGRLCCDPSLRAAYHGWLLRAPQVMDVLVLLCCFILPPLGILLKQRRCTVDAFAAIILCAFFWFPAVIFAILVAFCGLSCAKAAPAPEPKV